MAPNSPRARRPGGAQIVASPRRGDHLAGQSLYRRTGNTMRGQFLRQTDARQQTRQRHRQPGGVPVAQRFCRRRDPAIIGGRIIGQHAGQERPAGKPVRHA